MSKTATKARGLDPKHAAVIRKHVGGKSKKQAYKEVYKSSDATAEANGPRLLGSARVKNALQQAMRAKGLDEGSIAETLGEIRKNRDWRAKDAYVDRASQFLGYSQNQGTNIQVNMGMDFIDHE